MLKKNILHLITALENGGAEKILCQTIIGLNSNFSHQVIVLKKKGVYRDILEHLNIPVIKLSLLQLFALLFISRKNTIIHSYLYHSHLASIIFKLLGFHVIWSIHSSIYKSPGFLAKLIGVFSYFVPNKIIYVSNYNRDQHFKIGYARDNSTVIYNGVDVVRFNANNDGSGNKRDDADIRIGMVARYHPIKNHEKFAAVAGFFIKKHPNVKFYLIGKGNVETNKQLVSLLENHHVEDHFTLLGEVANWANLTPCFNLLVSTSNMESFGLTLLEALLLGINVSTIELPVMDELLGTYSTNDGNISDSELADRWFAKSFKPSAIELREYIKNNYSLEKMIMSYENVYKEFLG